MKYKYYNLLPSYGVNTYLLWDEESLEGIIIDPADASGKVVTEITKSGITIKLIVNTHGHGDHIGGNTYFSEKLKAEIAIHSADADMLTDPAKNLSSYINGELVSKKAAIILAHNSEISLGNKIMRVIHTPGHTRGSICLLADNYLFSGDTLFAESVGRTDLPGGNQDQILSSITKLLFVLPDDTYVLPGHGKPTTIGDEKIENPFVGIAARL